MRHIYVTEDDLLIEIIHRAKDLRALHIDAQAAYPILDAAIQRLDDKRNDRGEFAPQVDAETLPVTVPAPPEVTF